MLRDLDGSGRGERLDGDREQRRRRTGGRRADRLLQRRRLLRRRRRLDPLAARRRRYRRVPDLSATHPEQPAGSRTLGPRLDLEVEGGAAATFAARLDDLFYALHPRSSRRLREQRHQRLERDRSVSVRRGPVAVRPLPAGGGRFVGAACPFEGRCGCRSCSVAEAPATCRSTMLYAAANLFTPVLRAAFAASRPGSQRQRQAGPQRKFQIGGVVGGHIVPARQLQRVARASPTLPDRRKCPAAAAWR